MGEPNSLTRCIRCGFDMTCTECTPVAPAAAGTPPQDFVTYWRNRKRSSTKYQEAKAAWDAASRASGTAPLNQDAKLANLLTNVNQILQVVKQEWADENCWSAFDQEQFDGIIEWLRGYYERAASGTEGSEALDAKGLVKMICTIGKPEFVDCDDIGAKDGGWKVKKATFSQWIYICSVAAKLRDKWALAASRAGGAQKGEIVWNFGWDSL